MTANTTVVPFCGGTIVMATSVPKSGNLLTAGGTAFGLLSWSFSGITVADIDVTHFATTGDLMEYIPACFKEGGTIDCEVILDPDDDIAALVGADAENITVQFPQGNATTTGSKWIFSGYINSWGGSIPIDDKVTSSISIKVAGDIAVTASV